MNRLCFAMIAFAALLFFGSDALGEADKETPRVKFEIRLAQKESAEGLEEMVVPQTKEKIYVHKGAVLSNADVAEARTLEIVNQTRGRNCLQGSEPQEGRRVLGKEPRQDRGHLHRRQTGRGAGDPRQTHRQGGDQRGLRPGRGRAHRQRARWGVAKRWTLVAGRHG